MYSVVIIDDEKLVINSLALGFDWQETNFEIVETFQSSIEARKKIPLIKPDLVLCDIKMPYLSGLELMEQIKKELPLTQFIFVTGYEDFSYAKEAIRLGAAGYIVKPIEDEELLENLCQIEKALVEKEKRFATVFEYATLIGEEKNVNAFKELLENTIQITFPCIFASSINSLGSELKEKLHFYEWKMDGDLYFYVIPEPDQIEKHEIEKRIKKLLIKKEILGFKYVYMRDWNGFTEALSSLSKEVYEFFLSPMDILENFEIELNTNQKKPDFLTALEQAYCDNASKDFIDLLSRSDEWYQPSERTIDGTLKVYCLTMKLLNRMNNEEFHYSSHISPQILMQYDNFNQLISKLQEMCYESMVSKKDTVYIKQIKNDTFKYILNYINQNYTNEISFAEISKLFSINPSYLSQIFKRELGITFTQYLTDTRIEYAKELLLTTGLTISEISEKVGFKQYIYFSKVFKKSVGVSPSSYRKKGRSGELK